MSTLPIDTALLPADVRKAGPKAEQLYSTALDFERVLLQQLTSQLDTSSLSGGSDGSDGSDDGSGDGSDASTSSVQSLIPDAFAQSLTASGGVGVARQLYDDLKQANG